MPVNADVGFGDGGNLPHGDADLVDNSLGDADYYEVGDYAGFSSRLLIMCVDSLILLLLGIVLWVPLAALLIAGVLEADPSACFWGAYLVAIWLYLAPLKRSVFGTIGYQVFRVRLVSAKGGRPSLFNMTVRMVMWMFGPFNILLDLMWLGADTESQSLRDCYLGTYLIKRDAIPIGRAPLHLTRYYAMGFAISYPRVCRPRSTNSSQRDTAIS